MSTQDSDYTKQLIGKEDVWWKRHVDVQVPYRWNLRRINPGFVLDIGCGLGRNLRNLGGNGVGIDHNSESVSIANQRGFNAYLPGQFLESEFNREERFDSLLLSHVAEHMTPDQCIALLNQYSSLVKRGGKIILICPQEAGFKTDTTHIRFMDFTALSLIAKAAGFMPIQEYSFPFPRFVGKYFPYNEFISIGVKPAHTQN